MPAFASAAVRAPDRLLDLRAGQVPQVLVPVGVVRHQEAGPLHQPCGMGRGSNPLADHEERRRCMQPLQRAEQLRCDRRRRPVVEGQRHVSGRARLRGGSEHRAMCLGRSEAARRGRAAPRRPAGRRRTPQGWATAAPSLVRRAGPYLRETGAMRDVVVLGSTGSVGTQALDIVRANPDRFRVVGLTAGGSNPELFERQVAEFARPTLLRAGRGRLDRGRRAGRATSCSTRITGAVGLRPDAGRARRRQHARAGQQGVPHHRRPAGRRAREARPDRAGRLRAQRAGAVPARRLRRTRYAGWC